MKILAQDMFGKWNAWSVDREMDAGYLVSCKEYVTALLKSKCDAVDGNLVSSEIKTMCNDKQQHCRKYDYETCYLCGRDMHTIYVEQDTDQYVCRLCARKNALRINIIME